MYLAILPLVFGCGATLLIGASAGVAGIVVGAKAVKELTKDKGENKTSKV